MSDDLISRKAVLNILTEARVKDSILCSPAFVEMLTQRIKKIPTAFDKEKVIEELKTWEKASYNAGIQSTYAELDNKASGYYQESRAYHRAIEIVKKGGIENEEI